MKDEHPDKDPASATPWESLVRFFFLSFGYMAVKFLLAPVQIRVLTTLLNKEQYGTLTLLAMTVTFVAMACSLGHFEFMVRRLPGRSEEYQFGVLRRVWRFFGPLSAGVAALGILLVALVRPVKVALSLSQLLACGLALVLLVYLLERIFFLLARGEWPRVRALQVLYADTWFLPLLLFAAFFTASLDAALWTWSLWLAVAACLAWRWVGRPSGLPALGAGLGEILRFGVPLLPLLFGEYLFRIGDRYVLLDKRDIVAVANYSLCMNVSMIVYAVGASALDLFIPEFSKARNVQGGASFAEVSASGQVRRLFTIMLRYGLIVSLSGALFLALYGPQILRILSGDKFQDAAYLTLWVAPVPVFFILWSVFNQILLVMGRSAMLGGLVLAAAGLNLLLNLLMVPRWAERGSAVSIAISLGLLVAAAVVAVRGWRWIQWESLLAPRLALMVALNAAGLYGIRYFLGAHALPALMAAAAWCLGVILGLRLVRGQDWASIDLFPRRQKQKVVFHDR